MHAELEKLSQSCLSMAAEQANNQPPASPGDLKGEGDFLNRVSISAECSPALQKCRQEGQPLSPTVAETRSKALARARLFSCPYFLASPPAAIEPDSTLGLCRVDELQ